MALRVEEVTWPDMSPCHLGSGCWEGQKDKPWEEGAHQIIVEEICRGDTGRSQNPEEKVKRGGGREEEERDKNK